MLASVPIDVHLLMRDITCDVVLAFLQVKVGVDGAEESGEAEEWFNLRMRRVAPEACASFLGSFVSDATKGQFTEGGKWLVWKYEVSEESRSYICGCSLISENRKRHSKS